MKKRSITIVFILSAVFAFAQQGERPPGPPKPPPVAERWKHDSTTIATVIRFTPDKSKKTKSCFYSFYKDMDALLEKNKGVRPAKEDVDKLLKKRDESVKAFLTKEEYAKYDGIKMQLMPGHRKEPPPPKK